MANKITPKDAIGKAKDIVREMFSDEKPEDVGLEEIRREEDGDVWLVIIGFSRPWDSPINRHIISSISSLGAFPRRSYKVIRLDSNTGEMISLTDHEFETKK